MKLMEYLKTKSQYPKAVLALGFIVIFIIIIGLLFWSYNQTVFNKGRVEQSFAQQYKSRIRNALFDLVLSEGRLSALSPLSSELYRTHLAVQERLKLRSKEMSIEWKTKFKENQLNLGFLLSDSTILESTILYINNLATKSELKPAEIEVLTKIKEAWNEVDKFSDENELNRVSVGYVSKYNRHSSSSGSWTESLKLSNPDADLIAIHGYKLIKNLLNVPRTIITFLGQEDIIEINVSDNMLFESHYSCENVNGFEELIRNYSFEKVEEQPKFKPQCYLHFYQSEDEHSNPLLIEVGEKYIRITKTAQQASYEEFKEEQSLWKEWLYKSQIEGMYKSDPRLLKEIKEWISQ